MQRHAARAALMLALVTSLASGSPAQPAAPAIAPAIARLKALPVPTSMPDAVRAALLEADRGHDATIAEWLRISRVGALPGQEAARARLVRQLFDDAGLQARILPGGNVEARMPGATSGTPAVISAHLDALHAPAGDHAIRIEDGQLVGPGVLDDASGLVALTRAARLLVQAGWKPQREIRFVATVGEEVGLVGARDYLDKNPQLAAFVTIDGILGAVDYGATGIRWTRFALQGRGGHTLLADRTPSPSFAAGRAIAAIASLADETDAPINVSRILGDAPPNAIPNEVSFTVDVRSDDPDELSRLCADIARVVRAAADREAVTLQAETIQDLPAAHLQGHEGSRLVLGAIDILSWLDVQAVAAERGSADHNIALLRRIPGIAVGATIGRHAHAPEEIADVKALQKGVKQVVLLSVLLGEGLTEDAAVAQ